MAARIHRGLPVQILCGLLSGINPPTFLVPTVASIDRSLSSTPRLSTTVKKTKIRRRDPRDPYALRQGKLRKDANLSRQAVLREQRVKELGDPIRGIPTPFVESFDTVVPQDPPTDAEEISLESLKADPDRPPQSQVHASGENHLNHGVTHEELAEAIETSRSLAVPISEENDPGSDSKAAEEAEYRRRWDARHTNATEAMSRIVSLASGSSEQRTKKNVQRVVETFGRHNTDQRLKPKATPNVKRNVFANVPQSTPRAGPDTGSSEVQIGILTAKIRVLADRYEGENRNDKINKRNLRLLLHRRQKLLSYMEKKERGSGRWQHMIQTLGLTPACWKGQIAVE